ncbi:MAG: Gfo/Idh/MocA family oxidoreductase [Candidatus Sungbacteria bacterium]|nr:Gfo/Idh/MocA family oxidoreductase [Candidatus Sungbacteria bacterium]
MDKKVKVGLIGFGYWGPNLARNFEASALYDLTWIADVSPGARELAQKTYPQAKTVPNYQDILRDKEVELIVVATPPSSHYEICKDALYADKHVFAEKPLATRSDHAQDLINIANKAGKILAVDNTFLYSGPVRKLKEVFDSGEIGKPYFIHAERLNIEKLRRPDVNAFWDLAIHDISILDYLFNGTLPTNVAGDGQGYTDGYPREFGSLFLRYPGKVTAQITASWLLPQKSRKMTIVGDRKTLYFDDTHPTEKIKLIDRDISGEGKGDCSVIPVENKESLQAEIEELYRAVRGGHKLPSMGEDGLRIIKILEAADESIIKRKDVRLY